MSEKHLSVDMSTSSGYRLAGVMKDAAVDLRLRYRIPQSSIRHIQELLDTDEAHEALRKGAEALGFAARGAGSTLQQIWAEAVGPEVEKHTKALTLRGNILTIKVDSSVWVQELAMFQKVGILDRLHKIGQGRKIRNIRIELA